MLDEEVRAAPPLDLGVAEDRFDLRADEVGLFVARVRRVDVGDERQLLDERAVARLRLSARSEIAAMDVDEAAEVCEQPGDHRQHEDEGEPTCCERKRNACRRDRDVQDGVSTRSDAAYRHTFSIDAWAQS